MRSIVFIATVVLAFGCNRNREEPFFTPAPLLEEPSQPAADAGAAAQPTPAPAGIQAAVPPGTPQGAPPGGQGQTDEIEASHILVMHRESQRVPAGITRSRDEARARATEALSRVRNGEDFGALARVYSDEPGAGERGGALGRFRRGVMVPPFEQAAFALAPNATSEIVETPFGFHIIRRTR